MWRVMLSVPSLFAIVIICRISCHLVESVGSCTSLGRVIGLHNLLGCLYIYISYGSFELRLQAVLCVVSIKLTPSTRRKNAGKPVNLLTIVIICWITSSGRVITSLSLTLLSGFVVVEVLFVCLFFFFLFFSFVSVCII